MILILSAAIGLISAGIGAGLYCFGYHQGQKSAATLPISEGKTKEEIEKERRELKEQQEAFVKQMQFNAEQVYGLNDSLFGGE